MAVLKQFVVAQVNQAGADESGNPNAETCFGLPGSGGVRGSMSSCHFEVKVAVYDDETVYVGINGQVSDPVIAASDYDVAMAISPTSFTWSNGYPSAGATMYKTAVVDASDGTAANAPTWASGTTAYDASLEPFPGAEYGWFKWDMGAANALDGSKPTEAMGYKYIGKLSQFGADSSGKNGAVYIGGTGTYAMNDPVYPTPFKVTVPGFVTPAVTVQKYYPFAIRKSRSWASANRTGGSTTIRKSSSWRDVKNDQDESATDNKGFYRSGGKWVKAPKL